MFALVAVPGFKDLYDASDCDWVLSLVKALAPPEVLREEESDNLRNTLDDCSMSFCCAAAAIWCVMLLTFAKESPLCSPDFRFETGLSDMLVPAAEDGRIEMIQRLSSPSLIHCFSCCTSDSLFCEFPALKKACHHEAAHHKSVSHVYKET